MIKSKKQYYFIFILLVIFILLTILVTTGNTYLIDIKAYDFVISFKNDILTKVLYIITMMASTKGIITISLILLIMFFIYKKLSNYKYIFINLLLAVGLSQALKFIIQRIRPVWKWIIQDGYSYPSGHTISSFALYGTLILLINKNTNYKYKTPVNILLSIIIILTGISRIYFGAHYFTDVLASIILGFIILIISNMFMNKEYNNDKDKVK